MFIYLFCELRMLLPTEATSLGRRDCIWGNVDSLGTLNNSITEVREIQSRNLDFPREGRIGRQILTGDLQC